MHARVSYYELGEGSADDVVRAFDGASGSLEQMRGNQGAMLLVDEGTKKAITITFWESEDALRESTEQANQTRQQAAGEARMTITGVESYAVASEFGR